MHILKAVSGDGGHKSLQAGAYTNGEAFGSLKTNISGGVQQNISDKVTFTFNIPSNLGSYTGDIWIAVGFNNISVVTYDIYSIELIPKN